MGNHRVVRDLPGEVTLEEGLVEVVVDWLCSERSSAALRSKLAIGRKLLQCFFTRPEEGSEPDYLAWMQSGQRHASYRALAAHPACPWSSSYLNRCVSLAVQSAQLADVVSLERLGIERAELLLPIPVPVKSELAKHAVEEEWSARRLDHEVGRWLRHNRPIRPGRPRTTEVEKLATALRRELRRAGELQDAALPNDANRCRAIAAEVKSAAKALSELALRLEHNAEGTHDGTAPRLAR